MKKFNCVEGCGECCRHIHLVEGLKHLQSGDGICQYLVGDKCSIYKDRPDLCKYDKVYEMMKDDFTLDEFDKISIKYCEQLQNFKLERGKNGKETPFIKTTN